LTPSPQQFPKLFKKILIREMAMTCFDDRPCLFKDTHRDDGFECTVAPDPHLRWVVNASVFEFEGSAVVDVSADIFRAFLI